ncbi:MAG: 50S ribosomal protein L11 methyltransferase [Thiotrichales bacterium]
MQIRFGFRGIELSALEPLLERMGAEAVTLEDAEDHPLYEPKPGEMPLWPAVIVSSLFPIATDAAQVRNRLESLPGLEIRDWHSSRIDDQDWHRAWMDQFEPMRFGERLWIVPSWHTPPDPAAVNLMLDPGLAFGSGTHPTTALCLEWIDANPPVCRDVLDYGCGSGVLALGALKLGARQVTGVDIDPQALSASHANIENNPGADGNYLLCLPEDLPASEDFDVVLANILANTLTEFAPHLAERTRSGGWAILSGVLDDQVDAVAAAYRPWFDIARILHRDGWARLDCQRL